MHRLAGWICGVFVVAFIACQVPGALAQASRPDSKAGVSATVNLNTATAAELEGLPGVGPKTAERIIEYRQKNGGFKKIEDLMNVKGIGEKSFLKLKPRLSVAPSKPERAATGD